MPSLSERADQLDAADPLAAKRAEFDLDPEMSYLDGNSLGAPPKGVAARLAEVIGHQWARRLIRSWDEGWWTAPERVGDRVAPLVGAAPGQVVVGDSTSVNLFKALVAACRIADGRDEVLVDAETFPTDGYIADGAARLTGHRVRRVPVAALGEAVSERTAVVLVNHVDYRTGALRELPLLTAAAHERGALVLADLCHSVGALPIELDALGVDFAVGCTYKFLNGGPGSPAFLYVPSKWQEEFDQPLAGWVGHRDPFAMEPGYRGAAGVRKGMAGTPDILSMLALDAALDVWDGVRIGQVREKGLALGEFAFACVDELAPGVEVLTPRGPARGNQVSLAFDGAREVTRALADRAVLGDFRPPDVLRLGLAPLYVRYTDVLRAVRELRSCRT
ncbi:kynureninase [Amycolatopsis minnesotensis]|uniref:Kynureninase n=1 Tax=Amycolatopsis minnesotensis TaxID=337894 RepID=A0ABN2RPV6_9PSEU